MKPTLENYTPRKTGYPGNPGKPSKKNSPLSNQELLERHTRVIQPVRTLEVHQVDVEKIDNSPVEMLYPSLESPEPEPTQLEPDAEHDAGHDAEKKRGVIEKNGDGIQVRSASEIENFQAILPELRGILVQVFNIAQRVYQELGSGHTENIYHKALAIELGNLHIQYETEKRVLIIYQSNGRQYTLGEERIDLFLLDYGLIMELKAVSTEPREPELAQVRKYYRELLKQGDQQRITPTMAEWGVIINFPQPGPNKKAREDIDFVIAKLS